MSSNSDDGKSQSAKAFRTDRSALEQSCTVEFVRGSGPGGQHRNKRETGVRLTHEPTGTRVMATERREQSMNRELAFHRMAEKLEALQHRPRVRRATRPTRGSQRRRLDAKSRRGATKQARKTPSGE